MSLRGNQKEIYECKNQKRLMEGVWDKAISITTRMRD